MDVLFNPRRLFERLHASPTWIVPMLVAVAAGIVVIVALPDQVFVDSMQGATTRRGVPVEITSEPGVIALWERLRLSLGVAVTHPVKAIMLAGFTLLAFGRNREEQSDFARHFAVAAHVLVISALGALVALPFQIAAADPGLAASLALVAPQLDTLGFGGRLLAAVNPFTVWMLTVMAMGVGFLNRRSPVLPLAVLNGLYLATVAAIVHLQG